MQTHNDENILHYSLNGALPEGEMFVLDKTQRTFSHMGLHEGRPILKAEIRFTPSELAAFVPLLIAYPYYCSHEDLYAQFLGAGEDEAAIAMYKATLQKARADGFWDREMTPLRVTLSRTRDETKKLGIDILSILETGYVLHYKPLAPRKERQTDALPVSPKR